MAALTAHAGLPRRRVAPLVGREREQAVLRELLAAARAGEGSLVLIGGEAGIGKTALAETLGWEAVEQSALVLVGRCYDLTETPPYGPWTELLAQAPADTQPAPPFRAGVPTADAANQAALFAQVHDFLASLAAQQPLVLLLDDLHWADPASLDLLRSLGRRLAALPLLLLVTYRSDELTRRHPLHQLLPTLVRETHAVRLDLRRLDQTAVRALVRSRYRLPRDEEARLVAYLYGHAEGNPFYVGELLRSLVEEGLLGPLGQSDHIGDLTHMQVPALLRQIIEGRLARLAEEAQHLLAIAAVLGQEVPLDLWAAVSAAGEAALLDVSEQATEAHLVEATDSGIRFAHALIREALYEGILPLRRRAWHQRAAEALLAGPAPDPDAVAYHLRQARDPRATDWLIAAAERARRAYAWLTASERYEAALALLAEDEAQAAARGWLLFHLGILRRNVSARQSLATLDEAARVADAIGDRALAATALFQRGMLYIDLGRAREGRAMMAAGVAAVEALPSDEHARLHQLSHLVHRTSQRDYFWGSLALFYAWAGDFSEALTMCERFQAQRPVPGVEHGSAADYSGGRAYLARGMAQATLGRPGEARPAFAAARLIRDPALLGEIATQELRLVALPYHPEDIAARRLLAAEVTHEFGRAGIMGLNLPRLFCVPLLVLEGEWAEARRLAQEGSAAASLPGGRKMAAGWLGFLAREQGEPALAWAQVRAVLPAGPTTPVEEVGMDGPPRLRHLAGALALDAGDLPTARAWLEAGDRWLTWSGSVLGQAEHHLLWAAYYRAAGQAAEAHRRAQAGLTRATAPRQPLALLAAHRLLGELAIAARRYPDAAAHLDDALALADACAAPYERALTLLAYAELRLAMNKHDAARSLLAEARSICEMLGARRVLAQADALATALAAPPPASTYPAGLTSREVDVLRLVAQGLADAEVADQLYLSVHTVKTHLRSIYNKLAVSSRAAAARFAAEHQLV
ncbi:MAG: AAA family ATPase [Thermomicrobiales bacterium]